MIRRTFQLTPGVGPAREKDLWRRGVVDWKDFPTDQVVLSQKMDAPMREKLAAAELAFAARDLEALQAMLPNREKWRLYPDFADEACFLDIETDGTSENAEVTCIGILHKGQVRAFVPGHNLEEFELYAPEIKLLVTFNGSCFDVPVLERFFRHLKLPRAHIDLRFVGLSVGVTGGLKQIERSMGLERPLHLKGVNGLEAVRLWRAWRDTGSREALRLLVEYNLYDAIQLKPLMERIFNKTRERELAGAPVLVETERGDLLYDVSRVVDDLESLRE